MDFVIESLQADIIFGRLRPREELLEDTLMDQFQVKRHVVRSALQELVSRNVVTKQHGKSARVKDFGLKEVCEIYDMRALLQHEAVIRMSFPIRRQCLSELSELYRQHEAVAQDRNDFWAIHKCNDEFHKKLFSLSNDNTLCKAIVYYMEMSNSIRSYGIANRTLLGRAIKEHREMISALKHGDREHLAKLVVDHMRPAQERWESLRRAEELFSEHVTKQSL